MGTAENNKTRANKGYLVIRALGVKAIKEQFGGSNFSIAISCGGLIQSVRQCKTAGPAWRELEMPGGVKGNSVTRDLDRTSTTAPLPTVTYPTMLSPTRRQPALTTQCWASRSARACLFLSQACDTMLYIVSFFQWKFEIQKK